MKTLWFGLLLLAASPVYGQDVEREPANVSDPNAPATVKAINTINDHLAAHVHDLTALMKSSASYETRSNLLSLLSQDADLMAVLSALRDEASAWALLDDANRLRVQAPFEHTRACLQNDLEMTIPVVSQTVAALTSPRFTVEATQNKTDLRKTRDWVAAFRFRMTDPHYGPQR